MFTNITFQNSMVSFESFPKIDAHFHSTSYNPIYDKIAKDYNVRYLNINTDAKVFPPLKEQEAIALMYMEKHKQCFSYIASFQMNNWENEGWYKFTFEDIIKCHAKMII